jgi:hypothetical protein
MVVVSHVRSRGLAGLDLSAVVGGAPAATSPETIINRKPANTAFIFLLLFGIHQVRRLRRRSATGVPYFKFLEVINYERIVERSFFLGECGVEFSTVSVDFNATGLISDRCGLECEWI